VLSPAEVLAASTYMLHLANGEAGYRLDDQDHFANRRIRSVASSSRTRSASACRAWSVSFASA